MENVPTPKRRKLGKGWKIVFITFGCICLLLYGILQLALAKTGFSAAARIYDAEKAKFATIISLAKEDRKIAPGKNAEPEFSKLINDPEFTARLKKADSAWNQRSTPRASRTQIRKNLIKWMRPILPELDPFYEKLHKLSSLEFCIRPEKTISEEMIADSFPVTAKSRTLVKNLVAACQVAMADGDTQRALRYLQTAARIARWQGDDRMLIGLLVRIASNSIIREEFKYLLAEHSRDQKFLEGTNRIVSDLNAPYSFDQIVLREAMFARELEKAIMSSDSGKTLVGLLYDPESDQSWLEKLIDFSSNIPTVRQGLLARSYEAHNFLHFNRPKDPEDFLAWEALLEKQASRFDENDYSFSLAAISSLAGPNCIKAVLRDKSMTHVLEQAVAAATVRNKTGQFPTRLPLAGKVSLDLIIQKPLRFAFDKKNQLSIWSVGINGKDDGGIRDATSNKDDFGITLR